MVYARLLFSNSKHNTIKKVIMKNNRDDKPPPKQIILYDLGKKTPKNPQKNPM